MAGRDVYKESNVHVGCERYSPVRRASDGCASIPHTRQLQHLEKLYKDAVAAGATMKQIQQEHQQLKHKYSGEVSKQVSQN